MSLTVMTFNLRYASDEPPNAWAQRRPVVAECLRVVAPDLVGTQEGYRRQLGDLTADHPEYAAIGCGRDADGDGETATILYRRDRFALVEHGHFWLSDTPEVAGSTSWGNTLPRMATWGRFHDHESGRDLVLLNTHLDHESATARVRAAELICARLAELDPVLPVIMTGDFNAIARADPTYQVLIDAGLVDLRFAARERVGPELDSFHGYATPGTAGDHIDWILSRGPIAALSFGLVDTQQDGQYPSDHFPLAATLELGG